MSENYFVQLSKIQCPIEKKNWLSYVSWADAWAEVKKIHPDANYTIYEDDAGFPFWSSKYGLDVKVGVTIGIIEHIVRLPVMDYKNKSMLDNATTVDINKAIQRAFTKAIAMHGIGLYVYQGEDLPEDDTTVKPEYTEKKVFGMSAFNKYEDKFKQQLYDGKTREEIIDSLSKYDVSDDVKVAINQLYINSCKSI